MASPHPKSWFWLGSAAILVAAFLLRFADLGGKPIHADESVHAWKVGELLGSGDHRYDPAEYHGPTLHYLGAIVANLAGENSSLSLQIRTLRLIPAAAGVALVALTLCLAPMIGRAAALAAAGFTATSPLLVYYSRHFIQEPLFILFTAAAWLSAFLALKTGRLTWAVLAGASFGLVIATKETWVLVAAAGMVALAVVAWRRRSALAEAGVRRRIQKTTTAFAAACAVVTIAFYSAFFTDFGALFDFVRGLVIGAGRSAGGIHDKPWHAYFGMLVWNQSGGRTWTELPIIIFAIVGGWFLLRRRPDAQTDDGGARFWGAYAVALAAAHTLIPYKIIWLACGFWHGFSVLAGWGAAELGRRNRSVLARGATVGAAIACFAFLGRAAWRAAVKLPAYPRNPYAYVTTSTDIERLHPRLEAIAKTMPEGRSMTIKVGLEEYWPLPWLLRDFPSAGFWLGPPTDWNADVLLVSPEVFSKIPATKQEQLATEIFGLRDGVLVILAMDRAAWERTLPAAAP
ncbi:MAG: flippase activity-associated protein Agl23 [Opitutaceae bacterium]